MSFLRETSISSENSDSEKWSEIFYQFEKKYKEAYFNIDKAVKLDEEGKTNEALPLYESGLDLIDKALEMPVSEPSKPDLLWEKFLVMIQMLQKTRKEIIIRKENVKCKTETNFVSDPPPSYDYITAVSQSKAVGADCNGNNFELPRSSQTDSSCTPISTSKDQESLTYLHAKEENSGFSYNELSQQLKEMKLVMDKEILFYCDNVVIYFITPDGSVSSTLKPETLIIARVHDLNNENFQKRKKRHKHHHMLVKPHQHHKRKQRHHKKDYAMNQPDCTFIKAGSWIYPLIPQVSPCFRRESGPFIFPDIESDIQGATIGIILPKEKDLEFHELLTHLLNEISTSCRSKRSVVADSSNYSSKIVRGASYIAKNLVRGAGSTAKFLDASTPKIIDKISPESAPYTINPALEKMVKVTKVVSNKMLDVTDCLATKVGMATLNLGRFLSPYIKKPGTALIMSAGNMKEEEATEKINAVLNFTSDAVEGISTIYNGLDEAISILAKSLANNTVQIIEYKYGQPAGTLTNDAIATLGNVYYTQHNFKILRPKGITKAALRGAGSAILEDYRNSLKPHNEFQGSGPGDGSGFSKA